MVSPVIITGGIVLGGASTYTMYQGGTMLALPAGLKDAPPGSFLGRAAGLTSAVGAYSLQNHVLNRQFAHLLTYEVPAKVEHWGFRDFLRVTGPFITTRIAMLSLSVATMGFVSTKLDVLQSSHK